MPITKLIRNLVIASGISLLFTVLIPPDPSNTTLLSFSPARWVLIAGFVLLFGSLEAAFILLRRRPDFARGLDGRLEGLVAKNWQREAIQFAAALMLFAGLYYTAELILTTDQYLKQIMLRLAPVVAFTILTCWQVLSLAYFRADQKKWAALIALSSVCTIAGIVVQGFMVNQLTRYYPRDAQGVSLSQYGLSLVSFLYIYRLSRLPKEKRQAWTLLAVYVAILLALEWAGYPPKYWPAQYVVALLAPAAVFAIPLFIRVLVDVGSRLKLIDRFGKSRAAWWVVLVGFILLAIPYLNAAQEHARVLNFTTDFTDQQEYLVFAKNARLLNFNYTGDHNRMPGYPFLQAIFYREDMSDAEFFEQGKRMNTWLSLGLLVCTFWFARRYLGKFESILFILIIAFSLYIFKAPYFQAEISFYFLVFIGYLLMQLMLLRPGWLLAASAGIVLGLAHLMKASVLVGLILFAAVYASKEVLSAIRQLRKKSFDHLAAREVLIRLGMLLVVFACFLGVIFPYIRAMKLRFGQYFYNVNTTFYVWYDDNFAAIAAEEEHHFAERWPSHLPDDELPGLRNYLRDHSPAQILERVRFGVQSQWDNILSQFSVTNYHLSYLALLLLALLADVKNSLRMFHKYPTTVIFALLYFVGYLTAFVWYSPISPERRFTYGLYIPFMFSILAALEALCASRPREGGVDVSEFVNAANLVMALTLVVNIPLVLKERMFFDRYGS